MVETRRANRRLSVGFGAVVIIGPRFRGAGSLGAAQAVARGVTPLYTNPPRRVNASEGGACHG